MGSGKRVRINVFVDGQWLKDLQSIAARDDRSVGEIVRESLREFLKKDRLSGLGPIKEYLGDDIDLNKVKSLILSDKKEKGEEK